LVQVLASEEFEDAAVGNSGWASGDFDGLGDFTSGDLVAALADGGYDAGPRPAAAAVPEPSGLLLVAGLLPLLWLRARGCAAASDPGA
jgi:hypothetical protein